MPLQQISIEKFKSIEKIEIPFKGITLLVGGNNNGKTSALQAIQFAVSAAQSVALFAAEDAEWASIAPSELMYVPAADPASVGPGGRLPNDKNSPIQITFAQEDGNKGVVKIAKGRNKNVIVSIENGLEHDLGDINNPYCVYVPGLAGISKQETLCSMGVIKRSISRGDANLYLRNVLWALKNQDERTWIEFQQTLKQIFPNLSISLKFEKDHDEFIDAQFSNESADVAYLPLECAGTGLLQILQIFSYLYLFKPQLILLDEPDAHLHPNNQKAMIENLRDLCSSFKTQVLISTHSRHLLNTIGKEGKTLWIDKGASKDADEKIVELLMEIGALDNYSTLSDKTREWIIFSEDNRSEHLKRVLDASGVREDIYGAEIISFNGCKNVGLVNMLAEFAKAKNSNLKSLVVLDRDFQPEEDLKETIEKMKRFGHICIFTRGTDVESYYSRPEHIHALFPSLDLPTIQETLSRVVIEGGLSVKSDYVNWWQDYERQNRPHDERRPAGKLLAFAESQFARNPLDCIQGKSLVALMHKRLQDLGVKPANLFQPSRFLKDDQISKIFNVLT